MAWCAAWKHDGALPTKACGEISAGYFTPVIVEWEHGSFDEELVEVSHAQAEKIIQYFRERWA